MTRERFLRNQCIAVLCRKRINIVKYNRLTYPLFVLSMCAYTPPITAFAQQASPVSGEVSTTLDVLDSANVDKINPVSPQTPSNGSSPDKVWSWQNIETGEGDGPVTIEYDGANIIQDGSRFTTLPPGFTGSPSDLTKLKDEFSLYEPATNWLQPGKAYFRKDLEKKRNLEADTGLMDAMSRILV